MKTINMNEIVKISGGRRRGYQNVLRPVIHGAGVAVFGGGPGMLIGAGVNVVIHGAEGLAQIAPQIPQALADINRLNDAQVQDRLNNPYKYSD